MPMTFQQYIDNPLGRRNAVFSQRDLYRSLYTDKFDKVLLREAGNIDYILYVDKAHDRYIGHFKIPSETVKKFYYDAVIMFYTDDAAHHSSNNLNDYYVKFFSNDPAFVFTYLRVFLKNDLFIEELKPKTSNLALKKDPKETNPYEIPGYSKILYFAYLFMKAHNLFQKHFWTTTYSKKKLVDSVEHTDKKIADRQELGAEQAKREALQRKNAGKKKEKRTEVRHIHNVPAVKQALVKNAAVAKTTPRAKTSKRVSKKK